MWAGLDTESAEAESRDSHMIAHGIDLVEISRIAELRVRHPERFLTRVFTEAERAYALDSRRPDERLAARFAAKEAVMKALGTGLADGIRWIDVEVVRDDAGRPGIVLHNRAAAIAEARGISRWLLSLTHTRTTAMASAIGLRDAPPDRAPTP